MPEKLIFSNNNKISNNEKKILIGQWLLLNKKIKKYEVLEYKNKIKDQIKEFEYVKKIYSRVLKNLVPILNNIHQKNYKEKDWEILLYYSLLYFISITYNKWNIIKKLKNKYNFYPIETFTFSKYYFLKEDSQSFFTQMKTEEYEDWIYSKIIKNQKYKYFEKKINKKKKKQKNFDNLQKLKLQQLLFPKNNNNYFLTNLAFPKLFKVKLNLKLNRNIKFYNNISFKKSEKISPKRNLFQTIKTKNNFEKFIYENLSEIFPKNFIENFEFIEKNINYLNWPIKPKVIFTSFEHYFNDVFKIYTMNQKREGAKFYILQHGHQGLNNFCLNYYEEKICNKYFSWGGVKNNNKNISPLFCPTTIGKTVKKNIKKDILLSYTEFNLKPWKFMLLPNSLEETKIYKDDILKLLSFLNKNFKKKITLKYNTSDGIKYTTNEIKKRFKNLDFIQTNLKKRGFEYSNEYKLNIETTNSTGFIELLYLNIPVILVTNNKFYDPKKEYKKYFDELVKCNIIFFDVKKASDFINHNINNLNKWWFDEFTQKRIKNFRDHICKHEKDLNRGLNNLINQIR